MTYLERLQTYHEYLLQDATCNPAVLEYVRGWTDPTLTARARAGEALPHLESWTPYVPGFCPDVGRLAQTTAA